MEAGESSSATIGDSHHKCHSLSENEENVTVAMNACVEFPEQNGVVLKKCWCDEDFCNNDADDFPYENHAVGLTPPFWGVTVMSFVVYYFSK